MINTALRTQILVNFWSTHIQNLKNIVKKRKGTRKAYAPEKPHKINHFRHLPKAEKEQEETLRNQQNIVHTRGVEGSNPPLATIKETPENTMFRGFFICFIQLKSLPKYALLVNLWSTRFLIEHTRHYVCTLFICLFKTMSINILCC